MKNLEILLSPQWTYLGFLHIDCNFMLEERVAINVIPLLKLELKRWQLGLNIIW